MMDKRIYDLVNGSRWKYWPNHDGDWTISVDNQDHWPYFAVVQTEEIAKIIVEEHNATDLLREEASDG